VGICFDGALVDLDALPPPPCGLPQVSRGAHFIVTGNHDEFADSSARSSTRSEESGFRVLDNEKSHGWTACRIVGIHDGVARDDRTFREILVRSQIERNSPSVLLNHQPSHLSIPQEAGNLAATFRGHTHKGQFLALGTHLVGRIFRGPFAYGFESFSPRFQVDHQ